MRPVSPDLVTESQTGAAKLRSGELRRTPKISNAQRLELLKQNRQIRRNQEGKAKITPVNKNSFSIEIKTDSDTTTEVTALPPSFDYWNGN
jgi:hypothetical protein